MSEPFLDDLRMHCSSGRHRRPAVPEIGQPDRRRPSRATRRVNSRENLSGCNGLPSTLQNTRDLCHASLSRSGAARRFASCGARALRRWSPGPGTQTAALRRLRGAELHLVVDRARRIVARPAVRSSSAQRKPKASPRRIPIVASRRYAVQCRFLRRCPQKTSARSRSTSPCPGDRMPSTAEDRLRQQACG